MSGTSRFGLRYRASLSPAHGPPCVVEAQWCKMAGWHGQGQAWRDRTRWASIVMWEHQGGGTLAPALPGSLPVLSVPGEPCSKPLFLVSLQVLDKIHQVPSQRCRPGYSGGYQSSFTEADFSNRWPWNSRARFSGGDGKGLHLASTLWGPLLQTCGCPLKTAEPQRHRETQPLSCWCLVTDHTGLSQISN